MEEDSATRECILTNARFGNPIEKTPLLIKKANEPSPTYLITNKKFPKDYQVTFSLKDVIPSPIRLMTMKFNITEPEETTIQYTDCHEASLMRFVQMCFFDINDPKKIDLKLLREHVKDSQLPEFFAKYPEILDEDDFHETTRGKQMRIDWTLFISDRTLFEYKIYGRYELAGTMYNLLAFFITFFKYDDKTYRFYPDDRFGLFSRPGSLFTYTFDLKKSSFGDYIFQDTDIHVQVNGEPLTLWKLTDTIDGSTEKRVTGHSEMYPPWRFDKPVMAQLDFVKTEPGYEKAEEEEFLSGGLGLE